MSATPDTATSLEASYHLGYHPSSIQLPHPAPRSAEPARLHGFYEG